MRQQQIYCRSKQNSQDAITEVQRVIGKMATGGMEEKISVKRQLVKLDQREFHPPQVPQKNILINIPADRFAARMPGKWMEGQKGENRKQYRREYVSADRVPDIGCPAQQSVEAVCIARHIPDIRLARTSHYFRREGPDTLREVRVRWRLVTCLDNMLVSEVRHCP